MGGWLSERVCGCLLRLCQQRLVCLDSCTSRKPLDGVLFVEGPWRDNEKKRDNGASKDNEEASADVLVDVAIY